MKTTRSLLALAFVSVFAATAAFADAEKKPEAKPEKSECCTAEAGKEPKACCTKKAACCGDEKKADEKKDK